MAAPESDFKIMPEPNWQTLEVSTGCDKKYFYSEYDPTKRFYYSINREEDDTDEAENFTKSREDAWDECYNYHISFEQPFPQYVNLYRITTTQDNTNKKIDCVVNNTLKLPVQSVMNNNSYPLPDHAAKLDCYNRTGDFEGVPRFYKATEINKALLQIADFMEIGDYSYDSESSLAERISNLNAFVGYNLPLEKGIYRKIDGQWIKIGSINSLYNSSNPNDTYSYSLDSIYFDFTPVQQVVNNNE